MRVNRFAILLLLAVGITGTLLAQPTHSWPTWMVRATCTNQGRKVLRDANGRLHALLEATSSPNSCVAYAYSDDRGKHFSTEVIANSGVDQYHSSLGLSGGTPYAAYIDYYSDLPNLYVIAGAVRTGANQWTHDQILGLGQNVPTTTSTVMSPSDLTNPMAYTVICHADVFDGIPQGWVYVELIVWDFHNGVIRQLHSQVVDSYYIGSTASLDMMPSIAVSSDGTYDTLHLAYVYPDANNHNANGIFYRASTGALNPFIIRNGGSVTWTSRIQVSTISNPTTEPATEPSIEYNSGRAVVVWSAGSSPPNGIWERSRLLGQSRFGTPWPVSSNVSNADRENPESWSGGDCVTWQELVGTTNWETYVGQLRSRPSEDER